MFETILLKEELKLAEAQSHIRRLADSVPVEVAFNSTPKGGGESWRLEPPKKAAEAVGSYFKEYPDCKVTYVSYIPFLRRKMRVKITFSVGEPPFDTATLTYTSFPISTR